MFGVQDVQPDVRLSGDFFVFYKGISIFSQSLSHAVLCTVPRKQSLRQEFGSTWSREAVVLGETCDGMGEGEGAEPGCGLSAGLTLA